MGYALLNEEEGAEFAGVSVETIRKFSEIGLLASHSSDGESRFQQNELQTVFGVQESSIKEIQQKIILEGACKITRIKPKKQSAKARNWSMAPLEVPEENIEELEIVSSNSSELQHLHQEILELKLERDWLRDKVEKLEQQPKLLEGKPRSLLGKIVSIFK